MSMLDKIKVGSLEIGVIIKMIKIFKTNGDCDIWNKDDYTEYKYDGKCFIIIKEQKWVAIYNLKRVNHIRII